MFVYIVVFVYVCEVCIFVFCKCVVFVGVVCGGSLVVTEVWTGTF